MRELVKIINTGGTFNKVYDPVAGELVVAKSNEAVEAAAASLSFGIDMEISGIIFKDSLDMTEQDRKILCDEICRSAENKIVVVHGTDTMDKSAAAVAARLALDSGKIVIFTGAMVPFSIDKAEAVANLASALLSVRFLEPGVYIAMHGFVLPYDKITKNRLLGVFERVT